MNMSKQSILIIDDDEEKLGNLLEKVRNKLDAVEVLPWCPSDADDEDSQEEFQRRIKEGAPVLVVTDYDLTTAVRGLFGHSVVKWCRSRFIPVADFSRRPNVLSEEPDLFDLRVPPRESDAIAYIVRMFNGFQQIGEGVNQHSKLLSDGRSPAQILTALLKRQDLEAELAPYLSRPGLFNSSLLDALADKSKEDVSEGEKTTEKAKLLTYILGHVLANAVLKYPGPILAEGPLCAYLAISHDDIGVVADLFEDAKYFGPFGDGEQFFWRDKVDDKIEELADKHEVDDSEVTSFGDYHRTVVSKALGDSISKHDCERCGGVKGGFWCPFTKRAVCERSDCSSTASSWVPSGAYTCRVERDFFDEWAPILGF